MATGGSIKEISIAGRVFTLAADAEVTRKLGGYESETQPNGDATTREVLTVVPWSLSGLTVVVDENKADQDFLQDCSDGVNADDDGYYPITITDVKNVVRSGRGKPNGEVAHNSKNSTCALNLMGPGKLELQ
jgi:hypothetical protein